MFRRLAAPVLTLTFLLVMAVVTPSSASGPQVRNGPGDHPGTAAALPDRIDLPDGFLPEGIATGLGPFAWFGSRADGDIYRANLVTGAGEVVSQGPGTPSVGLKVDHWGRLFVAGGTAGDARVVNAWTGEVLASYQLTADPSFVNDVVLTRDAAWFTDSQQAQLYRLPLGSGGALPDEAETVPLTGEWVQSDDFSANGIAVTPDRSALLVVQSTTGQLFRVDPASGEATVVDLGGASVTNGDGLLVLGRTLFVVQNQDNQVAVVRLDRAGTSGTAVTTLTSPDFDIPTTVARFGGALYLPNARFTSPQEPTTEFWVTRLAPQH